MTAKIEMTNPLVELDGDEMTRVLWSRIKERLVRPHVELKTEYYDLGIEHRDETEDAVTRRAAEAILRHGVGVKCATITPNEARVRELGLARKYDSPNGTIRHIVGGTVFRSPIVLSNIQPAVRTWRRPIVVARHASGDVYENAELAVAGGTHAELVLTTDAGEESRAVIARFDGPGVVQGIHNTNASIRTFARACFEYALDRRMDLWFGAKDTISKTYDDRFRSIFAEVHEKEYGPRFERAGIRYFYALVDDIVARVVKSEGGFLWACKNYDGDVMSDMVASAFGSLALMTSVLVSASGHWEYEAAHGTVQRHYLRHRRGERTSTNSMALIFAWSGALQKRGELDGLEGLVEFAGALEDAARATVESGLMTGDLAAIASPRPGRILDSEQFLEAVDARLVRTWRGRRG
jgi:isocitrate dehydrogenase